MKHFTALYNDGVTAAEYSAEVTATQLGLHIIIADLRLESEWTWNDIRLAGAITSDRPVRILNCSLQGARLTLNDSAFVQVLEQNAKYLTRQPFLKKNKIALFSLTILLACAIFFLTFTLPRLAGPLAENIPMEWEEELGEQVVGLLTEIFATETNSCTNLEGIAALRKLTDRLNKTVDTQYEFKVRVMRSKIVNAFAAPGGHIVILSGLIKKAETSDEVAGVLAHEMGHVIKRHPTKALIHAQGWSLLLSALTGFSTSNDNLASGIALNLATSSYSRKNEAEADSVAKGILIKARINKSGLLTFFERLRLEAKPESTGIFRYFATHPSLKDRINAIRSKSNEEYEPALKKKEWNALQAICSD